MTAALRARHALHEAGLLGATPPNGQRLAGHPERVTNAINEVWHCGDYMVRVNPHTGATRLQREGALLGRLPAAVRAPVPVASGSAGWGEWLVTVRIPGQELSRRWWSLRPDARRRSIVELATILETIHQVPAGAGDGVGAGGAVSSWDGAGAWGAAGPWGAAPGAQAASLRSPGIDDDCPHALPVARLLHLIGQASALPGVDAGVLAAAAERLVATAPSLDEHPARLVHGDLHLENVLATADGEITGVLDFEWARPGPADLDLDVLLHSLAEPGLHLESGSGRLQRHDFDEVVSWLRATYPVLFAHPRLEDRLWVYRLSYEVKALLTSPPRAGAGHLSPHHPYQRIVRLLEGRSDLGWFLAS